MSMGNIDYLDLARYIAQFGTCSRAKVGALLVRDKRIISTGYNGAPAGMPHCNHSGFLDTYEGTGCKIAVHAEANVIAFAAKYGVSSVGATLYTTREPCYTCATLIINAGIKEVIYAEPYRKHEGLEALRGVGIKVGRVVGSRMSVVPTQSGDEPSVHPYEPRHKASGSDRRSTGEERGGDGTVFLGPSRATIERGFERGGTQA